MSIEKAIAYKKQQLPQFEHMWRVTLPELNSKGMNDSTGKGILNVIKAVRDFIFGAPDVEDDVSHRVASIDFPYRSYGENRHTFGSTYFHTAGQYEIGNCTIRVDEFEDCKTLKYFTEWQDLISNPDGTYNPPVVYKRDLILTRMAASGSDLHVSIYKNCWPKEISPASFSYESGGILQYTVVLVGDYVEHNIMPAEEVRDAVEEDSDIISEEVDPGLINRIKEFIGF